MDRATQIAFIRELSQKVAERLIADAGKWPEEWDGHELRLLLAKAHEQSARMSLAAPSKPGQPTRDRRRRREYLNTCAVRNIA